MKRPHPIAIIGTLMVIGAVWQIAAMVWSRPHVTNYPPRGNTIVVLGDSLTVGVGATSPKRDWVGIVEERLGVPIVRRAVSGDTTTLALTRLPDVLRERPDILVVLLGGNDTLNQIPESVTKKNLTTIITTAQKEGAVVLLLGVRGGLFIDDRKAMYEELSDTLGAAYVPDVLDGIFGEPALMADPIHPNDAGYLRMADRIAPALMMVMAPVPSSLP
jgi:acyl-CoA thioesterase I